MPALARVFLAQSVRWALSLRAPQARAAGQQRIEQQCPGFLTALPPISSRNSSPF